MDDTAQPQSAVSQSAQPAPPPVPSGPVGIAQKEQAPVINQEYIKPSEPEPSIPKEVVEAGVEKVLENAVLPPDVEKLDVRLAKESTPVVTKPTGIVSLPMTEEEVKKEIAVNKNLVNSLAWWLALVYKQFKKMHKKITS